MSNWFFACLALPCVQAGASLELQDALGRSALMFAAGNSAQEALAALLDAGMWMIHTDALHSVHKHV